MNGTPAWLAMWSWYPPPPAALTARSGQSEDRIFRWILGLGLSLGAVTTGWLTQATHERAADCELVEPAPAPIALHPGSITIRRDVPAVPTAPPPVARPAPPAPSGLRGQVKSPEEPPPDTSAPLRPPSTVSREQIASMEADVDQTWDSRGMRVRGFGPGFGTARQSRSGSGSGSAPSLASGPFPVQQVDQPPRPRHQVTPQYSPAMRHARVSGTVVAKLLIDETGTVTRIEIISDLGLDSGEVARQAFSKFRFEPARHAGRPVKVWIIHKMRFELR